MFHRVEELEKNVHKIISSYTDIPNVETQTTPQPVATPMDMSLAEKQQLLYTKLGLIVQILMFIFNVALNAKPKLLTEYEREILALEQRKVEILERHESTESAESLDINEVFKSLSEEFIIVLEKLNAIFQTKDAPNTRDESPFPNKNPLSDQDVPDTQLQSPHNP